MPTSFLTSPSGLDYTAWAFLVDKQACVRGAARSCSDTRQQTDGHNECAKPLTAQAQNTPIKLLGSPLPSPGELVSIAWAQELGQEDGAETGARKKWRQKRKVPGEKRCPRKAT